MGNLADELLDAFSDSEDEVSSFVPPNEDASGTNLCIGGEGTQSTSVISGVVHNGHDTATETSTAGIQPPAQTSHRRHSSVYGKVQKRSESDPDSPGLMPESITIVDAVDTLAREGTEHIGPLTDDVLVRFTDSLRDLGSQTGVEGSTARLITAHSALTTHLEHQTRQLQSLTFPIISPLVSSRHPEELDDLLPLLIQLSESVPRPIKEAYDALTALHSVTSDLIAYLSYLSDTVHMCRQTTTIVARRLKSAKDIVEELKRDNDLREAGELWLSKGNWSERLEKRECASVCVEVVGGFEELCNSWRTRLLDQATSAPSKYT